MYKLTEGALDKIMNGINVNKPILQVLDHKLLSRKNNVERYRLLLFDGKEANPYAMLATELNDMITNNILTENTICQINRYTMTEVNRAGKPKKVMVVLNLDVKIPGDKVGHENGDPKTEDCTHSKPGQSAQSAPSAPPAAPQNPISAIPNKNQQISPSTNNNILTTPIVKLNPYQSKWVIKARVVRKSDIKTWNNSRGEGILFFMNLADATGEIKCTAFRNEVHKFYDMMEIGKVYYISRATLKKANEKFNDLNNEYEMILNSYSKAIPYHKSDDDSIQSLQFNFEPVDKIKSKRSNDRMDILAVVKSSGDVEQFASQYSGKKLKKRKVEIVDESNTVVNVTLWETHAEQFDGRNSSVVAIKRASVGEYGDGKSLSVYRSSILQIDPDIPQAHRLRGWFNAGGCRQSTSKTIGARFIDMDRSFITFAEAKKQELGFHGKVDTYTVKATVNLIRSEYAVYKSCPKKGCMKKLIEMSKGMYRCEKCDEKYPYYRYCLLAQMNLADWSDTQWVTAFSREAEKILGLTGEELGKLKENDHDAYLQKFREVEFKSFVFKLRVDMEMYKDEGQLKCTVASVSPVDYKARNKRLISKIKEIVGIGRR